MQTYTYMCMYSITCHLLCLPLSHPLSTDTNSNTRGLKLLQQQH